MTREAVSPFRWPPPGTSGLTRLQLALMDQKISQRCVADLTGIPAPTISQYCLGVRAISRRHLPILAVALDTANIAGYCTADELPCLPNMWTDTNPFGLRRHYTTGRPDHHTTPLYRYRTR